MIMYLVCISQSLLQRHRLCKIMINRRRKRNVNRNLQHLIPCRSIFTTLQKMKASAFHGIIILVHSQVCVETLVVHHRQVQNAMTLPPLRLPRSNHHITSSLLHVLRSKCHRSCALRAVIFDRTMEGKPWQINFITLLNEEKKEQQQQQQQQHYYYSNTHHTINTTPQTRTQTTLQKKSPRLPKRTACINATMKQHVLNIEKRPLLLYAPWFALTCLDLQRCKPEESYEILCLKA